MLFTASSYIIHGLFCLTAGNHISLSKAKPGQVVVSRPSLRTTMMYYMVYQTVLQCHLGQFLLAELCVYSPPENAPLPDDTVVFLEA